MLVKKSYVDALDIPQVLCLGGRLTLLNSSLSSISSFYLSFFLLPSWIIAKLDKICCNFFWKGVNKSSRGYNLVSWGRLCKSKNQGGLGLLDLASFN